MILEEGRICFALFLGDKGECQQRYRDEGRCRFGEFSRIPEVKEERTRECLGEVNP